MRILFIQLYLLFIVTNSKSQQPPEFDLQTGNYAESLNDNDEESLSEDDSYMQFLADCKKNPVDLNAADEMSLADFRMLSALQIDNLIMYKKMLGPIADIHELQAVPGWDIAIIRQMMDYITIKESGDFFKDIKNAISLGDNEFLVRSSMVLQPSLGYLYDSSKHDPAYFGSPERISLRYRFKYKNFLQYGFSADKDAGEEFFKGSQRNGFDFYSAHIFFRRLSFIKALAIGDYTVSAGQGLLLWQSMSFKKSSEVLAIKRQSEFIKPYSSFGEFNFQRGAGITLQKKSVEFSAFVSYKETDANLVSDTITDSEDYVSSIQQSGLHRTISELADKNSQRMLCYGFSFQKKFDKKKIGINCVANRLGLALQKDDAPYNLYSFNGKENVALSVNYEFTRNNLHFFGEFASDKASHFAGISGLLLSVSSKSELAFLYRNISPGFQTFNSGIFSENSTVANEHGFYSALVFRPCDNVEVRAYLDLYSFPWLKYLVDKPGVGTDYLLQISYKPKRTTEITTRVKFERKNTNESLGSEMISPVGFDGHGSWRTQVNFIVNKFISLRNRAEISWYKSPEGDKEQGFMMYGDFVYKPMMKRVSGGIRLLFFDTDSYNSRVYSYEPDVLYTYSIPVFYGSGFRYCVNLNYDLSKRVSFWLKWSDAVYEGVNAVGSGYDMINKPRKSEIKLQMVCKW